MLRAAADQPRHRAGDGDHERALRETISGKNRDRRLLERVEAQNRIVLHNYTGTVDQQMTCDHPGCDAVFTVRLVPGQIVYPRWCPEHRTPHRRSLALDERPSGPHS
jgi:hypothetical protein